MKDLLTELTRIHNKHHRRPMQQHNANALKEAYDLGKKQGHNEAIEAVIQAAEISKLLNQPFSDEVSGYNTALDELITQIKQLKKS